MEKQKKTEKVELGKCPYCNSFNYVRDDIQLIDDFLYVHCSCNDCEKGFVEYFGLDEVKFEKDDDTIIFNNALIKHEKETLIKALNLLVGKEGDTKDYTRIFNVLNGGLNEE